MTQPNNLLKQVTDYWHYRADSYSQANVEELHSEKQQKWQSMLKSLLPTNRQLTVLDIGTGPGFLAILMAQIGHKVIAVDATEQMLQHAKENAINCEVEIELLQADAHKLPISDSSIDCIITRNVTWNLQQPELAYREWWRVLKANGNLINFDANWYLYLFDKQQEKEFLADRENTARLNIPDHYANTDTTTMENIARQLPLSSQIRPLWDLQTLTKLGFNHCYADTQINEKLLTEVERINYRSTPMFMIFAQK